MPPSLPPADSVDPTLPPPTAALVPAKRGRGSLPGVPRGAYKKRPDTRKRRVAMQAIAMRINGMTDDAIAAAFGLSKRTVQGYIYEAGKEGLLDAVLHDPKDRVEFKIVGKALDAIEEALDSNEVNDVTGVPIKTGVAMKVAESTVFKQFEQPTTAMPGTVVAIKIEMPPGAPQQMREGTTGGRPAYLDAEE